jgi:hypothetical protein
VLDLTITIFGPFPPFVICDIFKNMKGANVRLAVISTGVLVPITAYERTVTSVPWDKILVKDAMEHFNLQYILSATSAPLISSHSSSFLEYS